MNQQERNSLGAAVSEAAIFYGKMDFTKEQVSMMINVFEKYFPDETLENFKTAISLYIQDSKNKFMFSPATLKPYLHPELSPEAKANEVASRIRSAIGKFGWCNPNEARTYIGELGWKIVERSGGWNYICENHGLDLNPLTFHAQARDQVKALLETHQLGEFDKPIQIEQRDQPHNPDLQINERKRDQALALLKHLKNNEMPK